MVFNEDLISRIYGGWIGKLIGVIHGSNVEGWTYEKIKESFGTITDYPFHFKNFCSDDDVNGPAFFQRAMLDYESPSMEELAETFLNYVSDGHGFFWWGGYGISTEHTAYQNLMDGMPAKLSGSVQQNGTVMANQIGGQIFSDCWGFINPGNPEKAADMAERMSHITHDQNGVQGARFVAAAIASAFTAENEEQIFKEAYKQLNPNMEYARMASDVHNYCSQNPEDWENAFHFVQEKYGYQHYQGVCHIIPNAAVIVLALFYGRGDFSNTINIANMCGWDTDCNVGNLGSILGVYAGIEGIDEKWLPQVNDFVCASGSLGYLNIQTVTQIATETLRIICKKERLRNIPDNWKAVFAHPEGQYLHFLFPKSTCTLRSMTKGKVSVQMKNVVLADDCDQDGKDRCLKITVPVIENNQSFTLFYQTYYKPDEFNDNRYCPDFSPVVYPGNSIIITYHFDRKEAGKRVRINPFITDRISGKRISMPSEELLINGSDKNNYSYMIPPAVNQIIDRVGIEIICVDVAPRETATNFILYIDRLEIVNHADYTMQCRQIPVEVWTAVDTCPAGFTYLRGIVEIADNNLNISESGKPCEIYTGNINWKDIRIKAALILQKGSKHYVLFRVQGTRRCYMAGIEDGYAVIKKKNGESVKVLAQIPYAWQEGSKYLIDIEMRENKIKLSIDGQQLLETYDREDWYISGCVGFGNSHASRTSIEEYQVIVL